MTWEPKNKLDDDDVDVSDDDDKDDFRDDKTGDGKYYKKSLIYILIFAEILFIGFRIQIHGSKILLGMLG